MEKIHGSNRTAVTQRISMMATAIIQLGSPDEELHDETDINANEAREIELARTLAAAWSRGEAIEAWHLPGIQDLIVA